MYLDSSITFYLKQFGVELNIYMSSVVRPEKHLNIYYTTVL